ncbi:MAG: putative 3-methyladenine glycosylase [Bacteroidetes bacterium]|jgi:DNA-3-methyladenine glycosylase|nr:putative 3-methyladenine glycosylase [Bacteroidota bacterium]MDF2453792.1 putative 3-methyladenine glycosylase [Bacteroidota bacterium]
MAKLNASYYSNSDVVFLARDLIGKTICTCIDNKLTGGIITETEAYAGVNDKASHAYGGRRTNRTQTMYSAGGVSYVYLCYGIHRLLNIVTNSQDIPHAVLVRAIYPTKGVEEIIRRRGVKFSEKLCVGPGKVSQALGIDLIHNNVSLTGKTIWLQDDHVNIHDNDIQVGPRIGVDYAGEDAKLPYRFWTTNYNF